MTINQHYIPDAYLKQWYVGADAGTKTVGEFYFFDIEKQNGLRKEGIHQLSKGASENYFYEVDPANPTNEFENWHNDGEIQLGLFYQALKNNNFSFLNKKQNFEDLVKGFISLPYRTKIQIDFLLQTNKNRKEALTTMQDAINRIINNYGEVLITIFEYEKTDGMDPLITCDNPFVDRSIKSDRENFGIIPLNPWTFATIVGKNEKIYSHLLSFSKELENCSPHKINKIIYKEADAKIKKFFKSFHERLLVDLTDRARKWVISVNEEPVKTWVNKTFKKNLVDERAKQDTKRNI